MGDAIALLAIRWIKQVGGPSLGPNRCRRRSIDGIDAERGDRAESLRSGAAFHRKEQMNEKATPQTRRAASVAASGLLLAASLFSVPAEATRAGSAHVTVQAPTDGAGWQPYYNYSVPTGVNIVFTYACPKSAPTPVNGAFNANKAARVGLSLVSNYRPLTKATSWAWAIDWPSGAPAGALIGFSIYCAP
jgi:hypothetical protein